MTTKKEMLDTFAENLEKERIKLGYTQCDFAKKLGISASSYRNIISRRVDTFSIMLAPKLYELTGRFLYEMFGQRSIEIEVLNKFRKLTDRQKAYITAKIEFELEMKAKEEGGEYMVAEKDKEECKKFADIFMSLPEDSKNMVIIYLSALRDREEADKARLQKT